MKFFSNLLLSLAAGTPTPPTFTPTPPTEQEPSTVSIIVGNVPIAPQDDELLTTVKSSAYSSWEVSILCASDTLPFDGLKSILHVTSGDSVGNNVFSLWRSFYNNNIVFGNPFRTDPEMPFFEWVCETNTYNTYKINVSPDVEDPTTSVVEIVVDDVVYITQTVDKNMLIGDNIDLRVWAGKTGGYFGTASTYLIEDLTYTRPTQCTKTLEDSEAFCDDGNFRVEVPLCAIEEKGIDPDDLFMNSENCRGYRIDDTLFFIAGLPNCRIVPTKNETDWYIYEAKVENNESNSIITRHGGIEIDLSCAVNTHVHLDAEINVNISFIVVGIDQDVGVFDVDMTVYNSSDFLVPVSPNYTFRGEQKVYVGFKNEDSDLYVDILNCAASPEIFGEEPPEYPLIQDGIAVDPSTMIIESGTATEAKFEFEAFQFKGYPEFPVAVMCEIMICEPGDCN